jgi:two-component system sensor histidine kinase KdpD
MDLFKTTCILTAATIIAFFFKNATGTYYNVSIIYVLAVVLISKNTTGYIWGIISSVAGVLGVNYYFTLPYFNFDFTKNGYPITFLGMLLISVITSTTTVHLKEHAIKADEREKRNRKLNEINNKLLSVNGLSSIVELALAYISDFARASTVFYPDSPQLADSGTYHCLSNTHIKLFKSSHEVFIAHWVFQNNTAAGVQTENPQNSSCTYLPLTSHDTIWGVIGIYNPEGNPLSEEALTALRLIISQAAIALERQHLSNNQQLIKLETEKEKMRANLLRAISHDLRTPLTGMIGISETLLKNMNKLPPEEQKRFLQYIYEDSNWLLHMVENLLTITRIKEGVSSVNKSLEILEEVITEAVRRLRKRYPKALIQVSIPEEIVMVPMDPTLIGQVIINLVENSIKYSGTKDPVRVIAELSEDTICIRVTDNGIGLPPSNLNSIFDGYSPSENKSSDTKKGFGIGLSICKTIILAHNGTIYAENNEGGGAVFIFTLPLERNKVE